MCFNTQPPEGGWVFSWNEKLIWSMFQHAAARRRLDKKTRCLLVWRGFQHAAARRRLGCQSLEHIPKAAVSTRSRPKAAGGQNCRIRCRWYSFNTQPPEGGWMTFSNKFISSNGVSTRSRPKAAGIDGWTKENPHLGFNTQPPEGGWRYIPLTNKELTRFQHAAARRRLAW